LEEGWMVEPEAPQMMVVLGLVTKRLLLVEAADSADREI
jgi:hypothetical protein